MNQDWQTSLRPRGPVSAPQRLSSRCNARGNERLLVRSFRLHAQHGPPLTSAEGHRQGELLSCSRSHAGRRLRRRHTALCALADSLFFNCANEFFHLLSVSLAPAVIASAGSGATASPSSALTRVWASPRAVSMAAGSWSTRARMLSMYICILPNSVSNWASPTSTKSTPLLLGHNLNVNVDGSQEIQQVRLYCVDATRRYRCTRNIRLYLLLDSPEIGIDSSATAGTPPSQALPSAGRATFNFIELCHEEATASTWVGEIDKHAAAPRTTLGTRRRLARQNTVLETTQHSHNFTTRHARVAHLGSRLVQFSERF